MSMRNITEAEVVNAIANGRKEDAPGGLRKATYQTSRNVLTVIYVIKGTDEIEIITAYHQ